MVKLINNPEYKILKKLPNFKLKNKKFKKIKKKSYWCTYKLAEFAEPNWFREWK